MKAMSGLKPWIKIGNEEDSYHNREGTGKR